eukprot:scaffold186300_cov34-Attheya_sp.AAC.3
MAKDFGDIAVCCCIVSSDVSVYGRDMQIVMDRCRQEVFYAGNWYFGLVDDNDVGCSPSLGSTTDTATTVNTGFYSTTTA